jgi:hypothetical protein
MSMLLLQGLLECASTLMKLQQLLQCTDIDVQAESDTRWKVGCYMKLFLSKEVCMSCCVLTRLLLITFVNNNSICTQHGCVVAADFWVLISRVDEHI